MMLAENLVGTRGVLRRMEDAFAEGDYEEVVRHFEKLKRRMVVFICEAPVPEGAVRNAQVGGVEYVGKM